MTEENKKHGKPQSLIDSVHYITKYIPPEGIVLKWNPKKSEQETKKLLPHAKAERKTLLGRPAPGGVKRLIARVKKLETSGKPLPFDHFLDKLT